MRHKQFKLSALLLLGLGLTGLKAQVAVPATGSNASGSGGLAGYSVGQVFYTCNIGTTGSVTHGVQQPYEISVVTQTEKATGINISLSAYPNPTKDVLTLKVNLSYFSNLSYQLYDIKGKLLQSQGIKSNETNIVMSSLVPSIYFVKVISENNELKTFKIFKN